MYHGVNILNSMSKSKRKLILLICPRELFFQMATDVDVKIKSLITILEIDALWDFNFS